MIPIDAKAETEYLMRDLFGFAKKMLEEYGEFLPFGGYVNVVGRLIHVGLDDSSERRAAEGLKRLKEGLRSIARRDGGRVFGYAVNVSLPSAVAASKSAIQFFLEHKDGYCAEVFFVYSSSERGITVDETFAQPGECFFFADASR